MKSKKGILAGVILLVIVLLAGITYFFSKDQTQPLEKNDTVSQKVGEEKDDTTDILIAYFSNSGNTENMAKEIQSQINGDIFEINRATDYEDLYIEAKDEIDKGARPKLQEYINLENYDIIFIGYPIWWDTTPSVINTFLEHYDLTDKTVIPFCTSSSDEITNSLNAIKTSAPNAEILKGLRLSSNSETGETWENEIYKWLEDINIK